MSDDAGDDEAPRKRRSKKSRTDKADESVKSSEIVDYDLDEEAIDGDDDHDSKSRSKARKLPTWSDTIDVVVETNISSRKKPPRKKRGGRPRRGGGNGGNTKDRDRS